MKQTHTISFDSWKKASRKLDLSNAHTSMDGAKQKVTVKFLHKKTYKSRT